MGYRSELRAAIYGEEDALNAYIISNALIFSNPIFEHFKNSLTTYTTEIFDTDAPDKKRILHVLELYGDSWKWYSGYKDVESWMKFMRECVDYDLNYSFIRIGEGDGDSHDVERENSCDEIEFYYSSQPQINVEITPINPIPFTL